MTIHEIIGRPIRTNRLRSGSCREKQFSVLELNGQPLGFLGNQRKIVATPWTKQEVQAAVQDYFDMLLNEMRGGESRQGGAQQETPPRGHSGPLQTRIQSFPE